MKPSLKVEYFLKIHYAPKTSTGPFQWAITLLSLKLKKNRLSLSWSWSSHFLCWCLTKGWLFHVLWKRPLFEKILYQSNLLGICLRYEEDHSYEIPESLRGFIATTETLHHIERMLGEKE